MARQSLELRRVAANQSAREAQQRIDSATAAQRLVDAVALAEREHHNQHGKADTARSLSMMSAAKEQAALRRLLRFDLF